MLPNVPLKTKQANLKTRVLAALCGDATEPRHPAPGGEPRGHGTPWQMKGNVC